MRLSNKILCFACAVICALLPTIGCIKKPAQPKVEPKEVKTLIEPKEIETKVEPKEVVTKVEPEEVETKVEPKEVVIKVEPEEVETKVEPKKDTPTVQLTLKFTAQDSTTYKVTTVGEKTVSWEGPTESKPDAFKGGSTGNRIEITFTQKIQSIDDKGNAVARITIKDLKYSAVVKDNTVMEFDSSIEKDQNSPFYKLIGQSYTIELSPAGQVSKIIEVNKALSAVKGTSTTHKTAATLLLPRVIKERHSIPGLPAADKNKIRTEEKWSNTRAFDFGMLGTKSFERIYTLKEIKDSDSGPVAIAVMKAIPSTDMAGQLHKEQTSGLLSRMFDSTDSYTGELKLDLKTGKVKQYLEELKSQWVAIDLAGGQQGNKTPAALRMTATRIYLFEKID